jgi:phosphomevalonate kinase
MTRLAFSGKTESGKTAVCDYLAQNHGYTVVSFSGLICHEIRAEFPVPAKPWDDDFRRFTILWGHMKRRRNPRHYIDKMEAWLESIQHDRIAVDSVRRTNELEFMREQGFKMVRVDKDNGVYRPGFTPGVDNDATETDMDRWDDWDAVVTAKRGDVAGLFSQVEVLL